MATGAPTFESVTPRGARVVSRSFSEPVIFSFSFVAAELVDDALFDAGRDFPDGDGIEGFVVVAEGEEAESQNSAGRTYHSLLLSAQKEANVIQVRTRGVACTLVMSLAREQ